MMISSADADCDSASEPDGYDSLDSPPRVGEADPRLAGVTVWGTRQVPGNGRHRKIPGQFLLESSSLRTYLVRLYVPVAIGMCLSYRVK